MGRECLTASQYLRKFERRRDSSLAWFLFPQSQRSFEIVTLVASCTQFSRGTLRLASNTSRLGAGIIIGEAIVLQNVRIVRKVAFIEKQVRRCVIHDARWENLHEICKSGRLL